MQKNLISLAKNAIILATLVVLSASIAHAEELEKPTVTLDKPGMLTMLTQPGVYSVPTTKPLNTLLIPIDPQDRWNVLYQETPNVDLISSIQFNPNLHVYVVVPAASVLSVQENISTDSAQVSSASAKKLAPPVEKPVITISKSEVATPPARPVTSVTVPSVPSVAPSELDSLFSKYGQEYGVSDEVLKHIALCESGLRPEALSSNGLYGGLYQFVAGTWSGNRRAMGLDPDPQLRFNAEEAIKTAAYKISRDGVGAWPICGKKATAADSIASL